MIRIFLVEDDEPLRTELCTLLQKYGYQCCYSDDFEQITDRILEQNPQLVLLDLNLPYYDGYHVCRELRRRSSIPIIIVTSRDSELDELMSMNLGADDFIVKPYNTQILLARIHSVLNRVYPPEGGSFLAAGPVTLDLAAGRALAGVNEAELTKNEMRILSLLMRKKGQIVPREEIMAELWQNDEFVDDNTLTVNINRLRRKLEEIGVANFLLTKRSQGYYIAGDAPENRKGSL